MMRSQSCAPAGGCGEKVLVGKEECQRGICGDRRRDNRELKRDPIWA